MDVTVAGKWKAEMAMKVAYRELDPLGSVQKVYE
jgi:hypothetical protein